MMDKDADTMVATATVTNDDWGPEKVLSVYDPAHRRRHIGIKAQGHAQAQWWPGGGGGMGGDMDT
jgi:hypothetical protein